jgi:hypothetical protein
MWTSGLGAPRLLVTKGGMKMEGFIQGSTNGASLGAQTWTWDSGIGNSSLWNIVYLSESTLYIKLNIYTQTGMDKILLMLKDKADPAKAMKNPVVIQLSDVKELRYSKTARALEIHCGKKKPITLYTKTALYGIKSSANNEIYQTLKKRLEGTARISNGELTSGSSIYGPSIGVIISSVTGGVFIWWATFADAGAQNTGRNKGLKNAMDLFLSKAGVIGTACIFAVVIAAFAAWLLYRMKNPHEAEVLTINNQLPD